LPWTTVDMMFGHSALDILLYVLRFMGVKAKYLQMNYIRKCWHWKWC